MLEVRTVAEIVEEIRSSYANADIIGIDGTDGVGKTTLAKELGDTIGATVFSLDDFVVDNRGSYIPNLRIEELDAAISSTSRPVVIEGVCLLEALEVVSLSPDLLIYVKRIAEYGHWYDEDECDPEEDEDALIERLAKEAAEFAHIDASLSNESDPDPETLGLTPLREEIVRYHCRRRPSQNAQIIFLRVTA